MVKNNSNIVDIKLSRCLVHQICAVSFFLKTQPTMYCISPTSALFSYRKVSLSKPNEESFCSRECQEISATELGGKRKHQKVSSQYKKAKTTPTKKAKTTRLGHGKTAFDTAAEAWRADPLQHEECVNIVGNLTELMDKTKDEGRELDIRIAKMEKEIAALKRKLNYGTKKPHKGAKTSNL